MVVAAGPGDALGALGAAAPGRARAVALPEPGAADAVLDAVEFLVLDHTRTDLLPALAGMRALRLVHTLVVGTDWLAPHLPPGVRLARPAGSRDNGVAEWVASALLGLASGLLPAARDQHRARWRRTESTELYGSRAVVVGAGSVGRAARDLLTGLGVRVTLVARTAREGVEPVARLPELAAETDALVLLVPATPETVGLVGAEVLKRLPDGAVVVNAARGPVLDTAALTAEVVAGRLLAVLDVTDPEPLPGDHPLWRAPGCVVSPHIAGATRQGRRRAVLAAAGALRRYAAEGGGAR
ncbi:NAD(P)-dependent oxidoreductase [Streptomyces sp. NPDC050560]|uniref:NAD(P)-dependent oxidoreductase n=1 Tax=Streptomyces sp. NPDC050560 TaxID=3365630 RepID=UPI0037B3B11F